MTSVAQQQAKTNTALAAGSSDLRKGTCTGIDWVNGVASVSLPGASLQLPMVGVPPIINERCWIALFGSASVVLGPVPRPPYGTVNGAPDGGLISVICDDTIKRTVSYSDPTGLTLSTRVALDWTGGGRIAGAPLADPNTGEPIGLPPVVATGGVQQRTFNPYTSGTWRDGRYASGWVAGELWDADHNRGGWFYQGIADTIPDNAHVDSMSVFVPASTGGYGGDPSVGGHSLAGPAGSLVITGRRIIPPSGGWIDITDLADAFKTGALLGIGTGGGGNWHFPPAGQNNSGAISATWRT